MSHALAGSVTVMVVGVGHWHATRNLSGLRRAGATIVGVQDADQDTADRWGRELGCPGFIEVDELLAMARPDLVLAMPRHADGPGVLRLLVSAGLPFIVEKPAAMSATALLPVLLEAEARGLFTAVPLVNRLSSFWTHLRQEGASALSSPSVARFRIVNGPPARYVEAGVDWLLDPTLSGGGALRNLGMHAADAFIQLARGPIEVVGAALGYAQHHLAVEEHAFALLRDENGLVGVIEAGYSRPDDDGTDHEWAVFGPDVTVQEQMQRVEVVTRAGVTQFPCMPVMERYDLFATRTIEHLRNGSPADATLRDCWAASDLIDRVYAQAQRALSVNTSPVVPERVVTQTPGSHHRNTHPAPSPANGARP